MESKQQTVKLEKERTEFVKLLAMNPNYFGTFPQTKLKAVMPMKHNTQYEELTCIGFYPEQDILEATVVVKLPGGYKGSLCTAGSFEYVRFYADWDGDGDFNDLNEDVGMARFNAHDIAGGKPLEYCVTVRIDPDRKICTTERLVKVRGILSWNAPPPPNTPDFPPVWGNTVEVWIQIRPVATKLVDVFDVKKLAPALLANINVNQPVSLAKKLTPVELKELYKGKDVPELRFNMSYVAKIATMIQKDPHLLAKYKVTPQLLATDVAAIYDVAVANLGTILEPPQNIKYEGLTCVGLNYDEDRLVAILRVKLPCGYSGGLCTQGSQEYVAFWVDWDKDGFGANDYVGTASVNTHDIQKIPSGGLQYACSIRTDFASHRKLCRQPVVLQQGMRMVKAH